MGRPKGSKNKPKIDLTNLVECGIVSKLDVGTFVRYYYEGWRVGKLVSIKKDIAVIAPMPALHGKQPHDAKVALQDVERID